MKVSSFAHCAFGLTAIVLLAACGGAQPPTAAAPENLRASRSASVAPNSYSFSVLYNFKGASDGSMPQTRLLDVNNTLYGTTRLGGGYGCFGDDGCGTVCSITRNGQEQVLFRFTGRATGSHPESDLVTLGGKLYGTTSSGGRYDRGTVFEITLSGSERVLYSFHQHAYDGEFPAAGLTAVNGVLYGTTYSGGRNNEGTVFKITTSGTETKLYSFGDESSGDGAHPAADLLEHGGMLYGTTIDGGPYRATCNLNVGCGTVFEISPSGAERVIYSFRGAKHGDGSQPAASLTTIHGALYGTTQYGGKLQRCESFGNHAYDYGCGVIFEIASGRERVVYRFRTGEIPRAGLIVFNNSFYGTTSYGGSANSVTCPYGCGTIFKVDAQGHETTLHQFSAGADGKLPEASLIAVNGVMYGAAANGSANSHACAYHFGYDGCGTVFAVAP